ncbi:hypothetical protein V1289_010172 [Bradyrhizobium sp. AZCC 2289]
MRPWPSSPRPLPIWSSWPSATSSRSSGICLPWSNSKRKSVCGCAAGASCRETLGRRAPAQLSQRHCEEHLRRSNPCLSELRDGLLRGACHRARIRATRWLAMTGDETSDTYLKQLAGTHPRSRGAIRPSFASFSTLVKCRGRREDRVRAAPAVSCAKCTKENAHEHTGSAETLRPSPRNGFTAYSALSPVTGFLATVIPEKFLLTNLAPASGRQDHTTSPSASATLVSRRLRVHRIPPRVRDDRDPPLRG